MSRRIISLILSFGLLFQQVSFAQVAAELNLGNYLSRIGSNIIQDRFRPLRLRYFSYDSLNDSFKILIDKGDSKNLKAPELETSTKTLLGYFLIGVSLPDEMFWVNLRPDSEDQIIDPWLEKTDVGKIMLEADLWLKKDTALYTSPQTPEGREYWNRLYKKAAEIFGNENITIPTLTRPWIVPGEIIVRESKDSAYIYKATLKVMLEQDYLKDSATYNFKDERSKALNEYSSQLIRELIIPKLTKEVNSGKRYSNLRQIYYSLILARWFKLRFTGKTGTYASLINTKDLTNLISKDSWSKTEYFNYYKKSFQAGEYNIKEPVYTPTGQVIRSYFSGGINVASSAINTQNGVILSNDNANKLGDVVGGKAVVEPQNISLKPYITSSPIDKVDEDKIRQSIIDRIYSPDKVIIKKLQEIRKNSGLPISTVLSEVSDIRNRNSDNTLWAQALRALHFDTSVYRRVEREAKTEERYTGQPVFPNANEGVDTDIKELTVYDVSKPEFYSIRKGEDVRGFILDSNANIPPEAYFMHRGVFASREDIQKAFYDNKIRFDITIIPPAIWGVDFAKTVGHYHDPIDMPEIYQVVSGEVLWLMQKCDEKGNVIDFITVKAKAGDIAIMLPGYGHVSVNISETEPLVMANWLTWHQSSYYGSFKDKKGAAYYVIRNIQGKPELIPNQEYLKTQKVLPQPRQMVAKDEIPNFGLTKGVPIYELVKLDDKKFAQKVRFLNYPGEFSDSLTPESTLNSIQTSEKIPVNNEISFVLSIINDLPVEGGSTVGSVFSVPDRLLIAKWIDNVGLRPQKIVLESKNWGMDPDSDHWFGGAILVKLVFKGSIAEKERTLEIGKSGFSMYSERSWYEDTPDDADISTILEYHEGAQYSGYSAPVPVTSVIFDPLTKQDEIYLFKKTFYEGMSVGSAIDNFKSNLNSTLNIPSEAEIGKLTEGLIQKIDAANLETLALKNLNDTFSLLGQSYLTKEEKIGLVTLLEGLYNRALPYFKEKKAAEENPIYHHTQVLYNMARIALGEKCEYSELKNLLVLALLHDIGNAISSGNKWTNDQIIAAFAEAENPVNADRKEELFNKAIEMSKEGMAFRLEHMEKGPQLINEVVQDYVSKGILDKNDVELINKAVVVHDYPSVEKNLDGLRKKNIKVDYLVGEFLLLFNDADVGKLVTFLREADRLFMLSVQGTIKDIQDSNKKNEAKGKPGIAIDLQNVTAQGKKNIGSHKDEYNLYKKAGKDDGGFINNESLYRTETGYAIFKEAERRFSNSSSPMQVVPEKTGGIDFRALPMTIQPMGSFRSLNFKLPQLSQAELRQINVDSEMQQIRNMVQSGIIPSGQRIKELVAACIQKKEMNSQADSLLLCLADIFKLEEENASGSSPELREALVIVDSQS